MKQTIFILIATSFFAMSATKAVAQQSRVDSVIMYLKKSFATDKLDSASYSQVLAIIESTSLTDSQIAQIESTLNTFINWQDKETLGLARFSILSSLINNDVGKAISYGKQQIEQLDKINTPEASSIKSQYLSELRFPFRNSNHLEDGFQYYTKKLNEYKIKNDSISIAKCHYVLGGFYRISGLLDLAIYNMKKSISYIDSTKNIANWYNNVGVVGHYYLLKENVDECLKYNGIANDFYLKNGDSHGVTSNSMVKAMLIKNQLDSAAYFLTLAKTDSSLKVEPELMAAFLQTEAEYKIQSGAFATADSLLQQCQKLIIENKLAVNAAVGTLAPDYLFAQLRIKQGRLQEAIDFLQKDILRLLNNRVEILRDYRLIAELYTKMGNGAKAAEAYSIFLSKQDSLLTDQEKYRSISFEAEQQMNEKELSIANLESQNRIASLSRKFLIGLAALLLLLTGGIYQRFRFKKKANAVLETTLNNLKSTQSQLIQSEKMASLGELTAGIAHEIQNPLNFVNNFSEVSTELIEEANEELDKGEIGEAKEILNDLKGNLQKINHHGKRADSIVKGMLQHSRTSTGQKELTDINALADEYLRLAYHGLRAKGKSFNADMQTDYDKSLPRIEVIPQDIGRVLLNLINNAFQAVQERNQSEPEGYQPMVKVSTMFTPSFEGRAGGVLITISDNGNGIPDSIKEKIFQPFFTTKPTGQGTGLGLSLAYDIVKAHGGEIEVESKENEATSFNIKLPIA